MVINSPRLDVRRGDLIQRCEREKKTERTVLIEENREIVGISERYFRRLHKIDLVVVGRDHF